MSSVQHDDFSAAARNTAVTVVASAPEEILSVTDTLVVSATSPTGENVGVAGGRASELWLPNHDMANVGLTATAQSGCDAHPSIGVLVYSTESDND